MNKIEKKMTELDFYVLAENYFSLPENMFDCPENVGDFFICISY